MSEHIEDWNDPDESDPNEDFDFEQAGEEIEDAVVVEDDEIDKEMKDNILFGPASVMPNEDDLDLNFPNLVQHVIGFRSFSVNGDELINWHPGKNVALCNVFGPLAARVTSIHPSRMEKSLLNKNHDAPVRDCPCGLYAYHDVDDYNTSVSYYNVTGAVKAWGRMFVAENGFRTQYAEVIGLVDNPNDDLVELCNKYQIPLFKSIESLADYAYTQGIPISKDIRPGRAGGNVTAPGIYIGPSPKKNKVQVTTPDGSVIKVNSASAEVAAFESEEIHHSYPDGNSVATNEISLFLGLLVGVLAILGLTFIALGNSIGIACLLFAGIISVLNQG